MNKKRRKKRKSSPISVASRFLLVAILAASLMFAVIYIGSMLSQLPEKRRLAEIEQQREDFIESILPYAIKNQQLYDILPSITLSQAILESNWGESELTKDYNNYFGIKSINESDNRVVFNTNEYVNGELVVRSAAFRAYESAEASFTHHGLLIGTASRYRQVVAAEDYRDAAHQLYASGYATDPEYPQKLIALIQEYMLYQYD